MKVITIKKGGKIHISEFDANGKITTNSTDTSLKEYLASEVEFGKGLTFGALFKLILKDKEFFDIVFSQELNGRKLQEFENELNKKQIVCDDILKLDFLEITKIFELYTFEKYSTIDLFPVFLGVGKSNELEDVFIPISFYSVNELKNLEIIGNKVVDVYKDEYDEEYEDEESEERKIGVTNESSPYFESSTRITLYEAIQGILFEISFHKNDEERLKIRKSQNSEYANKSRVSILERQLESHIEKEEYEKAAMVKRELDKLKINDIK